MKPSHPTPSHAMRLRALAWLVPALFFVKASILGMRVVPLWDVADEEAHLSYARDIWSGKGVQPLGVAMIGTDIAYDWMGGPTQEWRNQIVQHPPLFHALAGGLWKAATFFTDKPSWLFRAPRLAAAFFGALTLFYIFKIVERLGLGAATATAVAAGFATIPTLWWFSAGTHHDPFVAALGTASAYYLADFMLGRQRRSALLSLFTLSLAACSKITALVPVPLLIGLLALESDADTGWRSRLLHWAALAVAGLALPSLWLLRNQLLYGDALARAMTIFFDPPQAGTALRAGFSNYLQSLPVLDAYVAGFWGQIGWMGTIAGEITQQNIRPPFLTIYEAAALAAAVLALAWVLVSIRGALLTQQPGAEEPTLLAVLQRRAPRRVRSAALVALAAAAACAGLLSMAAASTTRNTRLLAPLVAVLVALVTVALCAFVLPVERQTRLVVYALVIFTFLTAFVVWNSYNAYVVHGQMRAVYGRYVYAALGYSVVGLCVPPLLLLRRAAARMALPVALLLTVTEVAFFFAVALPRSTGAG